MERESALARSLAGWLGQGSSQRLHPFTGGASNIQLRSRVGRRQTTHMTVEQLDIVLIAVFFGYIVGVYRDAVRNTSRVPPYPNTTLERASAKYTLHHPHLLQHLFLAHRGDAL